MKLFRFRLRRVIRENSKREGFPLQFCNFRRCTQKLIDLLRRITVNGGNTDHAVQAKGFHDSFGVMIGCLTLEYIYTALYILFNSRGDIHIVKRDRQDKISLSQVRIVTLDMNTFDFLSPGSSSVPSRARCSSARSCREIRCIPSTNSSRRLSL